MTVTAMAPAMGRSYEQRMAALARANETRSRRARLKLEVGLGRRSAWDVLCSGDEWVETMKVYELLLAIPRVGRVKLNKAFAKAGVSPSKTVGGISERQREALLRSLPILRRRAVL